MYKDIICGIYCIENTITHQKYVGRSVNIKHRWQHHRNELKRGVHDNWLLQESWNKYGESKFEFYILEQCEECILDNREIYYINTLNSHISKGGFNLDTGGQCSGRKRCKETLKIQSDALKQSYKNNPELRKKQSERAYVQWANPEIKAKILGKNNGMYGRNHTEEAKQKISEAAKGRISSRRNKQKVFCMELNKEFKDAHTAALEVNAQSGTILEVCRGKRKTCCKYHWKFI